MCFIILRPTYGTLSETRPPYGHGIQMALKNGSITNRVVLFLMPKIMQTFSFDRQGVASNSLALVTSF